ncbi:hypothetical protein WJX79_002099 [Trebouxia sp. C0005]
MQDREAAEDAAALERLRSPADYASAPPYWNSQPLTDGEGQLGQCASDEHMLDALLSTWRQASPQKSDHLVKLYKLLVARFRGVGFGVRLCGGVGEYAEVVSVLCAGGRGDYGAGGDGLWGGRWMMRVSIAYEGGRVVSSRVFIRLGRGGGAGGVAVGVDGRRLHRCRRGRDVLQHAGGSRASADEAEGDRGEEGVRSGGGTEMGERGMKRRRGVARRRQACREAGVAPGGGGVQPRIWGGAGGSKGQQGAKVIGAASEWPRREARSAHVEGRWVARVRLRRRNARKVGEGLMGIRGGGPLEGTVQRVAGRGGRVGGGGVGGGGHGAGVTRDSVAGTGTRCADECTGWARVEGGKAGRRRWLAGGAGMECVSGRRLGCGRRSDSGGVGATEGEGGKQEWGETARGNGAGEGGGGGQLRRGGDASGRAGGVAGSRSVRPNFRKGVFGNSGGPWGWFVGGSWCCVEGGRAETVAEQRVGRGGEGGASPGSRVTRVGGPGRLGGAWGADGRRGSSRCESRWRRAAGGGWGGRWRVGLRDGRSRGKEGRPRAGGGGVGAGMGGEVKATQGGRLCGEVARARGGGPAPTGGERAYEVGDRRVEFGLEEGTGLCSDGRRGAVEGCHASCGGRRGGSNWSGGGEVGLQEAGVEGDGAPGGSGADVRRAVERFGGVMGGGEGRGARSGRGLLSCGERRGVPR